MRTNREWRQKLTDEDKQPERERRKKKRRDRRGK